MIKQVDLSLSFVLRFAEGSLISFCYKHNKQAMNSRSAKQSILLGHPITASHLLQTCDRVMKIDED